MTSDLKNKCRTCLNDSSYYYRLSDKVGEHCKLVDMLDFLVPQIKIKEPSHFSTLLCDSCVGRLINGYQFRQLCIESNDRLNILHGIEVLQMKRKFEDMFDPLDTQKSVIKAAVGEYTFLISEIQPEQSDEEGTPDNEPFPNNRFESDEEFSIFPDPPNHQNVTNISYTIDSHLSQIEKRGKRKSYVPREHPEGEKQKCHYCPEVFNIHDDLVTHIAEYHEENISFQSTSSRKEFEGTHVPGNGPIQQNAYRSFNSESNTINSNLPAQVFNELQPPEIDLKSEIPPKEINKDNVDYGLNNFSGHIFDSSENTIYDKVEIGETEIIGDVLSDTQKTAKKPVLFTCVICGKIFNRIGLLWRHQKRVHQENNKFQCDICTYRFGNPQSFLEHFKRHKIVIVKCEMCEEQFNSVSVLTKHIKKMHPQFKRYECRICKRTFSLKENLLSHKNLHYTKERECHICNMVCSSEDSLTEHMLIHYPYLCPQCGKTICGESNLFAHVKSQHANSAIQ